MLKCQKCGESYSVIEQRKNIFCKKCGSYLVAKAESYTTEGAQDTKEDGVQIPTQYLPDEFKEFLIQAHNSGSQVLKFHGIEPEPLQTAFMVEEHRWFWKPKEVKFILVAESHVRTSETDVKALIDPNRLPRNMPKDSPQNFVKLVYCMGYGAPTVLYRPDIIENNAGTRQYVDLFSRLCEYSVSKPLTNLEYKAGVLGAFREKGLWLLDASVHACYLGLGKQAHDTEKRLPDSVVKGLVLRSWEKYVKVVIDYTSINPQHVWIIGKGVHDTLRGKYITNDNWIYQPNAQIPARLKKERENKLKAAIKSATSFI
jgi:hypothetical protein